MLLLHPESTEWNNRSHNTKLFVSRFKFIRWLFTELHISCSVNCKVGILRKEVIVNYFIYNITKNYPTEIVGRKATNVSKIWAFHGGDYDDYHLLGDDNHHRQT
jgi:accessory gene regulator protein AgrB